MIGRHPYGALFLDLPPEHVDPNVHPTKSDVRLRYGNQVFDAVRRTIVATLGAHAKQRFLTQTNAAESLGLSFGPPERDGAALRVLAQLDRTFILASDGEALILVDQHAAHERIAYESIVIASRRRAASEPLLVPLVVELDAARSAVLDRTIGLLGEGGARDRAVRRAYL